MSLFSIPFYNSLLKKKLFTEKEKDKFANYSHVLVYGAVSIHNLGEKGCIASNELMGNEIGMSSQTVANCLVDLNKAGWLKVIIGKGNRRLKIIPQLTIGVLAVPKAYSGEDTSYFPEEGTILGEVTPLTCTSNIDNILDKSIDNSKESNSWQALVLYFYSKISPETSLKFRNTTKKSSQHLLSLHPEEDIKKKIDALACSKDKKFITTFETFCNKYSTLTGSPSTIQPTMYFG